jgi:hypothetical protein
MNIQRITPAKAIRARFVSKCCLNNYTPWLSSVKSRYLSGEDIFFHGTVFTGYHHIAIGLSELVESLPPTLYNFSTFQHRISIPEDGGIMFLRNVGNW